MEILTLKQILALPYVQEKLSDKEVEQIKSYYDVSEDKFRKQLSVKLTKLNSVHEALKQESDPKKRSLMLLNEISNYLSGVKHSVQKAKMKLNEKQNAEQSEDEMKKLDEELLNI